MDVLRLEVQVIPGSNRNAIAGWQANRLRVSITAGFHHGAANVVTEKVVAAALGISPKNVRTVRGMQVPEKSLVVEGIPSALALQRLRVAPRRFAPGAP